MLAALKDLRPSGLLPAGAADSRHGVLQVLKRPAVASALVVVVLGAVAGGAWMVDRNAKISRAKEELLPQVRRSMLSNPYNIPLEVFALAQEAREYIEDDPEFRNVWSNIATSPRLTTDPPGADVMVRQVGGADTAWIHLGVTPLDGVELPRCLLQWRITKQGFSTREDVMTSMNFFAPDGGSPSATYEITLDPEGSIPEGMVRVEGDSSLGAYFMDRYEVTNRQYREFVRAGGYANRSYWKEAFTESGRRISWESAIRRFVDATGRPGPSTWRGGDYPDDEDDYPVRGVSWYEAAAFADFAGKKLPTVDHWDFASAGGDQLNTAVFWKYLLPASNFSDRGARPVGQGGLFGPYGLWDMAGNVREWCWNASAKGRCLMGGAWNDATYMHMSATQALPGDRSEKNGFRCMALVPGSSPPPEAFEPVTTVESYDLRKVKQVSDDVFRIYRDQYEYDRVPLQATTEFRDSSGEDWVKEKVSFDDLRAGERMSAYVYLPTNTVPPFQAVVYFPGSWARRLSSSEHLDQHGYFIRILQYFLKSGRAVVYPIPIDMYERILPDSVWPMGPHQYLDYRVRLTREYRRTIDYLESRPDIDAGKIAYHGMSWGGVWANLILAVEGRFKAAILEVGGLNLEPNVRPEVRMLYYTPRITMPVLMLNGEYDLLIPLERNVRPMFEMLGTPPEHKRLKIYPTDHFIPSDEFVKESLAWLDKYLGPVQFK